MMLRGSITLRCGATLSQIHSCNFKSRKRAINWLLRKLEREYPDCREYEATILELDTISDSDWRQLTARERAALTVAALPQDDNGDLRVSVDTFNAMRKGD